MSLTGVSSEHHDPLPVSTPVADGATVTEELKKERLRTGLSASAMGPRAVAGGE
jgi:hypothetical protein